MLDRASRPIPVVGTRDRVADVGFDAVGQLIGLISYLCVGPATTDTIKQYRHIPLLRVERYEPPHPHLPPARYLSDLRMESALTYIATVTRQPARNDNDNIFLWVDMSSREFLSPKSWPISLSCMPISISALWRGSGGFVPKRLR